MTQNKKPGSVDEIDILNLTVDIAIYKLKTLKQKMKEETKILDLIPDSLKKKLIKEVATILKEREKTKSKATKTEIQDLVKRL